MGAGSVPQQASIGAVPEPQQAAVPRNGPKGGSRAPRRDTPKGNDDGRGKGRGNGRGKGNGNEYLDANHPNTPPRPGMR